MSNIPPFPSQHPFQQSPLNTLSRYGGCANFIYIHIVYGKLHLRVLNGERGDLGVKPWKMTSDSFQGRVQKVWRSEKTVDQAGPLRSDTRQDLGEIERTINNVCTANNSG